MELFINILLLILGFVGAIAAIGGDTWLKDNRPILRRITRRGWLSIIALTLMLILGIVKEVIIQQKSTEYEASLRTLETEMNNAQSNLGRLREVLTESQPFDIDSGQPEKIKIHLEKDSITKVKFSEFHCLISASIHEPKKGSLIERYNLQPVLGEDIIILPWDSEEVKKGRHEDIYVVKQPIQKDGSSRPTQLTIDYAYKALTLFRYSIYLELKTTEKCSGRYQVSYYPLRNQ